MVWKMMGVQKVMWSIFDLEEHKRFRQSWKSCQNLCSLRWLKPNLRRDRNFKPVGLKILYMLLWTGEIKDNNLLLNNENGSAFLMLGSTMTQSFRVTGKKEYLKQSVRQLKMGILLFLVLSVGSHFGTKCIN